MLAHLNLDIKVKWLKYCTISSNYWTCSVFVKHILLHIHDSWPTRVWFLHSLFSLLHSLSLPRVGVSTLQERKKESWSIASNPVRNFRRPHPPCPVTEYTTCTRIIHCIAPHTHVVTYVPRRLLLCGCLSCCNNRQFEMGSGFLVNPPFRGLQVI